MRIGIPLANSIVAEINRMDQYIPAVNDYLPYVLEDLDVIHEFREDNPKKHALRCVLFALASPCNRFDANVIAARRLHHRLNAFDDVESVYQALTEGKLGTVTSGSVARSVYQSLPYLKHIERFGVSGYMTEQLRSAAKEGILFGAGSKVTAMAGHLWNRYDDVYTLDTHMLRGIVKATLEISGTFDVKEPSYGIIEKAMLNWSAERFPDTAPFAIQWALWSVFRGEFNRHSVIFHEGLED